VENACKKATTRESLNQLLTVSCAFNLLFSEQRDGGGTKPDVPQEQQRVKMSEEEDVELSNEEPFKVLAKLVHANQMALLMLSGYFAYWTHSCLHDILVRDGLILKDVSSTETEVASVFHIVMCI